MKSLYQQDNLGLDGEHNCAASYLNKSSLSTADHDFNHLFKHKETRVDVLTQHTHTSPRSLMSTLQYSCPGMLELRVTSLPRSASSLHQTSEPPATTSCLVFLPSTLTQAEVSFTLLLLLQTAEQDLQRFFLIFFLTSSLDHEGWEHLSSVSTTESES